MDEVARLAVASESLSDVLETLDLERDRELAEAVVEAVVATERAYRLERERLSWPVSVATGD